MICVLPAEVVGKESTCWVLSFCTSFLWLAHAQGTMGGMVIKDAWMSTFWHHKRNVKWEKMAANLFSEFCVLAHVCILFQLSESCEEGGMKT